jgi:hypothetical protein
MKPIDWVLPAGALVKWLKRWSCDPEVLGTTVGRSTRPRTIKLSISTGVSEIGTSRC